MITNLDIGSAVRDDVTKILNGYMGSTLRPDTPRSLEEHLNSALQNYKWRGYLDDDYYVYVRQDQHDPSRLNITDEQPKDKYAGHVYA
jgi:hypothetical protein